MTGQPPSLFEVDDESRPLADRLRPHTVAPVPSLRNTKPTDAPPPMFAGRCTPTIASPFQPTAQRSPMLRPAAPHTD